MTTEQTVPDQPPGELKYGHCRACGATHWFPRPFCPHCGSNHVDYSACGGAGRIAAVTIVHRAPTPVYRDRVPYAIALVDLDEGIRVMGHVPTSMTVGQHVAVRQPSDKADGLFFDQSNR